MIRQRGAPANHGPEGPFNDDPVGRLHVVEVGEPRGAIRYHHLVAQDVRSVPVQEVLAREFPVRDTSPRETP